MAGKNADSEHLLVIGITELEHLLMVGKNAEHLLVAEKKAGMDRDVVLHLILLTATAVPELPDVESEVGVTTTNTAR
jgi:hypothetical protein